MIDIVVDGKKRMIPSVWDELSGKQYIDVLDILATVATIEEKKILIIKNWLGISDSLFKKIELYQMYELSELTNFIFETKMTTKQLIDTIVVDGVSYVGPASAFNDITMSEYAYVEQSIKEYKNTQEVSHLVDVVAILYRPEKNNLLIELAHGTFDGHTRMMFNEFLLEDKKNIFKKHLNPSIAYGVYYWWCACHQALEEEYAPLFKGDSAGETLGFIEVITQMPSDKFGNIKSVGNEFLKGCFAYMLTSKITTDRANFNNSLA